MPAAIEHVHTTVCAFTSILHASQLFCTVFLDTILRNNKENILVKEYERIDGLPGIYSIKFLIYLPEIYTDAELVSNTGTEPATPSSTPPSGKLLSIYFHFVISLLISIFAM